ncbi:uncharacterized protein EKO05_0004768 [Ascochyta rabiei]|uniref:Uncharacterized protein n=1 Tax=Didymella rabiei TaxID=5454 RepID=A0A163KE47_DIDRA|nr:uncharacterized protein EKO05_0004768 [Ascochyta rabiei]KZM26939.1 hypothetical protein ST47_g1875 [Ascochyta rabiei]UPX14279.1 hypothetical protein EKO05_0004768 [Ascochyta rabiei]
MAMLALDDAAHGSRLTRTDRRQCAAAASGDRWVHESPSGSMRIVVEKMEGGFAEEGLAQARDNDGF